MKHALAAIVLALAPTACSRSGSTARNGGGGDLSGQSVPADGPPLFIAVAADDRLLYKVVEQFFVDWSDAGRPVEFHVFAHGGHGFGMSRMNLPVDRWIDLFGD